ncbi:ABC transporter permease [Yoonia litorea]|uniref:Putative spermidine/putrescine transport system permease protein n=1 Tax=Yoonia litorea TaxID=1123755 RepID=A0A1I6L579_9RHOB|nr:ABC transporter permease [Yoonia litorea]SFR98619.1 putative spermidine/putrescine transport system permease protein [Yoonia litorea]
MSDTTSSGPMLAADGTPLKTSLARALRRQKIRALALIAPLLLFVMITFIIPIATMLFRSVENQIVSATLPEATAALQAWDQTSGEAPSEDVFQALFFDLFKAAEAKEHTKLGTRLNYEQTGTSSLFRTSGRNLDDVGEEWQDPIEDIAPALEDGETWYAMMSGTGSNDLLEARRALWNDMVPDTFNGDVGLTLSDEIAGMLPLTAAAYSDWAIFEALEEERDISTRDPWEAVYAALGLDLRNPETVAAVNAYSGPHAEDLQLVTANLDQMPDLMFRDAFADLDEDWLDPEVWQTIKIYSPDYTSGYFLNAIDMEKGPDGAQMRPENQQIYITLFIRTLWMSLVITGSCILLGYPVAWLLANLPLRTANVLMILVLLPFWTSLLVRTSAWKVLLQQQGVINEILVWLGFVDDANRLILMNNATGTVIAMTHILLPFMILPLYSVMKTIPPSYLRAAKSLGATNWTAFWRVYFPQSVPGIGAGSILVFILSIGYYITPEIVGGTDGVFISNRIAYHISSSLNWGLAAALGTILLAVVLVLYWLYDRIVGIDNVKLGG